ncbi:MAG: beta-ketoacyl-ACP synthase [Cognaticolwellia sp.]
MTTCLKEFGVVCALGNNKAEVLAALLSGEETFLTLDNELPLEAPQYVGRVTLPKTAELAEITTHNNKLAYLAYQQIAGSLKDLVAKYGQHRIAVVIGTSTASIYEGELARKSLANGGDFPEYFEYQVQEMSAPATYIADLAQAKGPVYGISTACSSSGKALISANSLLENDLADVVIAGGIDSLTQLTVNGFKSLESISQHICQPFSRDRDGINIGEAAALFVMTKDSDGIHLLGAGETSDAYHISAPIPDGSGAADAMALAIKNAKLSAQQIDYVNLHGTGTVKNDAMEAIAMSEICGADVLCSSTKHLTGHTLGAAGALELGLCWLLLSDDNIDHRLPANCHSGTRDETMPLIKLSQGETVTKMQYCLSNSFAFGGNNFSAVIGKKYE